MGKSILVSLVAAAALWGCSSGASQESSAQALAPEVPATTVIAIDTSKSAAEFHDEFFRQANDVLMSVPSKNTVFVYRFDSECAEVYSGKPPRQMEQATEIVNDLLDRKTDKLGTNMAKLLTRIDKQVSGESGAVKLIVMTDSGTEHMTKAEMQSVREITQRWKDDAIVSEIRFIGVKAGHREVIRDMVVGDSRTLKFE